MALNNAPLQPRSGGSPVTDTPFPARGKPMRLRKLHLGHVAFMRAVVQGLDTRDSWDRYLRVEGEHDDIRNMRRTIAWLRDEFAAAAKRHDRFGMARLVQIDAARIAADEKVPTLEEFAADSGLLDFSEAEQLEYYQERYGTGTQRQSRRARLIDRQLEALAWLERLVSLPPQDSDAVSSWLHPDLAARLEAAGISTLRHLADRINGMGMRWWSGIRAIGTTKAQRIMDWLRAHEASTGLSIGAHVGLKRSSLHAHDLAGVVPRATGIVPLEKLVIPAPLDGSSGLFRAPREHCLLNANNDYQAVLAWIHSKSGVSLLSKTAMTSEHGVDSGVQEGPIAPAKRLSHTQRAYRKEAERFLLWAVIQHGKPLSSMSADDCEAYYAFLGNPTPAERWCAPRGRERWSPLWRPFEGPLSPRAQRQAVAILKSLYAFLVDRSYLTSNPWIGISPPTPSAPIDKGRSFTPAQWAFIERQLQNLPQSSANLRLVFAVQLLYASGLRLSEVVSARTDHLRRTGSLEEEMDGIPAANWELAVVGRSEKERIVPVPGSVIETLSDYLMSRGLNSNPLDSFNKGAFLCGKATDVLERAPWAPESIQNVNPRSGIAASTLYSQLKTFFGNCALALTAADPLAAERLAAASTHWLRHTYGIRSAGEGTPIKVLQQALGHAARSTTSVYASVADGE
jgi:site-specific recombinase XerD